MYKVQSLKFNNIFKAFFTFSFKLLAFNLSDRRERL
jgi:hypothetical protein